MELSEDDQQIWHEWQDVSEAQMSDDVDEDMKLLESLVLGRSEMTFNVLDADTAAIVNEAIYGLTEEHPERSSDDENIQCTNCGQLFTTATFELHICTHDEFHEPIDVIPKDSELLKLTRHIESIMKQNAEDSKTIQKVKEKITLECKRCSRTFNSAPGLQRHYEHHIGEIVDPAPSEDPTKLINLTLCVFCGQVFAKEEDAWDHLVSSHVDLNDDSEIIEDVEATSEDAACSEKPAKKLKLDENNNQATTSKSPQAPIMIAATQEPPKKSSAAIAMDLIKSVNLSKVYQCDFCDNIFACEKLMLRHVADHAPSCGYECKSCELADLTLKDMLLHRRDECVVFRDIRNPLRNFARVWVCNVCSEEFRGIEQLVEHRHSSYHFFPRIEPRTNQLVFGCEHCCGQFATAPVLVGHFSEKHLKQQRADIVPKTSNRTTRSPSGSRGGVHQTSTLPRGFLCDVCGKSYTQSSHLWQHLRFHQGVKPFTCTVKGCDRRFTIRPDLSDHVRKYHTGERPYLCTICNKRFLTGSVYYQHRLIHRGERRYGCSECSKRFYRADALKNHERIHSGEKPFSCHVCFKAFRQRGDRDKHMKSQHPDVVVEGSPKRARVKSYGRGRISNNTSLYQNWPDPETVPSSH